MTVKDILIALNLPLYSHISIRMHGAHGMEFLGGGDCDKVVNRFGDMVVTNSIIIDNILVMYVKI